MTHDVNRWHSKPRNSGVYIACTPTRVLTATIRPKERP